MAIYAIGDLHLSLDERIEKPMDVFGPSWMNHSQRLAENWRATVTEDDLVIICGDISWGLRLEEAMEDLLFVANLPGQKVLTKGNHDLWWATVSKLNALDPRLVFLQNTAYKWKNVAICGTRGWICPGTDGFDAHDQKIYDRELLRLGMSIKAAKELEADTIIAALHYPPSNDKHQESGFTEMLSGEGIKTCVYGHLHGRDAFKNGYKGIWNGVDYKLVSLDYIDARPLKIWEE